MEGKQNGSFKEVQYKIMFIYTSYTFNRKVNFTEVL